MVWKLFFQGLYPVLYPSAKDTRILLCEAACLVLTNLKLQKPRTVRLLS